MQPFAIIEDTAELESACKMLGMLLSPHLRQRPSCHLLGIWIEAELAERLPPVLAVPTRPAQQLRIRESTSLSSMWTLCWCDSTAAEVEGRITRGGLLQALLAAPRSTDREPGVFAPVFAANADANEVRKEMELLRRLGAGSIISPLYQDRFTAGLFPVQRH